MSYIHYRAAWASRVDVAYPGKTKEEKEQILKDSWSELDIAGRDSYRQQTPIDCTTTSAYNLTMDESSTRLHTMESAVEAGLGLLEAIKVPLTAYENSNHDAKRWTHQIDTLKQQVTKPKTLIAIVGSTGAGKSSIINALLGEERLVPTNCMRACTSVVTIVSYNHGPEKYRAQIEFLSAVEWEKEIGILFRQLTDEDGDFSKDYGNSDTDAGIAYAKIMAAYPTMTKEKVSKSSVVSLLRDPGVSQFLGTSKEIKEENVRLFYKVVQGYIDSKEKSSSSKEGSNPEGKEMELWPLIRVVRIFVKSPVLETGAVLVDLPGVQDSNPARAAVAENYLKQSTGVWIISPITRAVDDKVAKSMLGDTFKLQLKMDGRISAVTFVCSKTDDIDITEAQESLGLEDDTKSSRTEMERLFEEQMSLASKIKDFQDSMEASDRVMNNIDDQIEDCDDLIEGNREKATIFTGSKRKSTENEEPSGNKKRLFIKVEVTHEHEESLEKLGADAFDPQQVQAKIRELRLQRQAERANKQEAKKTLEDLESKLEQNKQALGNLENNLTALCISRRNQYCKNAIRLDYAAGIKELDEDQLMREDEQAVDLTDENRDYEAIGLSLPVFCVSSRGFQNIEGRFRIRKDQKFPEFKNTEDTEIPQLRAHCVGLTQAGTLAQCQLFINKFSQLMNSLALWASSDRVAIKNPSKKIKEPDYLQEELEQLEKAFDNAIQLTCQSLKGEFEARIFRMSDRAVKRAVEDAVKISTKWGQRVNLNRPASGGLYFSTYRAICRAHGNYVSIGGRRYPQDWNVQLAEPMTRTLATGWEICFSRRTSTVLLWFVQHAVICLKTFHQNIELQADTAPLAGLSMLNRQVKVNESILRDISSVLRQTLLNRQKDINRAFNSTVRGAMSPAYNDCIAERGKGSFERMKNVMEAHIAQARHVMFRNSMDEVNTQLLALVNLVGQMLNEKTKEVFTQVKEDYGQVLGNNAESCNEADLPETQKIARKEILRIIGEFQANIGTLVREKRVAAG